MIQLEILLWTIKIKTNSLKEKNSRVLDFFISVSTSVFFGVVLSIVSFFGFVKPSRAVTSAPSSVYSNISGQSNQRGSIPSKIEEMSFSQSQELSGTPLI